MNWTEVIKRFFDLLERPTGPQVLALFFMFWLALSLFPTLCMSGVVYVAGSQIATAVKSGFSDVKAEIKQVVQKEKIASMSE